MFFKAFTLSIPVGVQECNMRLEEQKSQLLLQWHTSDHSWWHSALSCLYFVYLGSSISGDSIISSEEVKCRIGKASGVFARLKECVWKATQHKFEDKDEK